MTTKLGGMDGAPSLGTKSTRGPPVTLTSLVAGNKYPTCWGGARPGEPG